MMNPETREFEPATDPAQDPKKADWPRLHIGQEVEVGGVPMRIRKITKKDVVLRPSR